MNDLLQYSKRDSAYPGEHILKLEEEKFKLTEWNKDTKSLVLIDADNECYKIEMTVPGARREDFIVNVRDNVLFIATLPNHNNEGIEQHLLLPSNADSEFVSAECRQGLLRLYISKTNKPSKTTNQIVVY